MKSQNIEEKEASGWHCEWVTLRVVVTEERVYIRKSSDLWTCLFKIEKVHERFSFLTLDIMHLQVYPTAYPKARDAFLLATLAENNGSAISLFIYITPSFTGNT